MAAASFALLLTPLGIAAESSNELQEWIGGIKARGEKGDVEAQFGLGLINAWGLGVAKDDIEAAKWFRKAADQGNPKAQFTIGTMYENGEGVVLDPGEGMTWCRKAADRGYAKAQDRLGRAYRSGNSVEKDDLEALKWFRKAADQGDADAIYHLGTMYDHGQGVVKDKVEARKWYRKAAEQGNPAAQSILYILGIEYVERLSVSKGETEEVTWCRKAADLGDANAQCKLGGMYETGEGVARDYSEAVNYYRKAANQGHSTAQIFIGLMYGDGRGVPMNTGEKVKWFRKAANQGDARAQLNLGYIYGDGRDVVKNEVEAYKWMLIAGSSETAFAGSAQKQIPPLENRLTPEQRGEGQRLAKAFKPRQATASQEPVSPEVAAQLQPEATGTGFFITEDGYLITNEHVANEGASVRVLTSGVALPARVVKVDRANDLALLKVQGKFIRMPVTTSRGVRLGSTVATVGFPNIGLQGFAPKLTKGEISSLTGVKDDSRFFQISVAVQPGNSGGALVDERGNVVGVVSAKLSASAALSTTGALPENVNYAVKSSYLLSFLESVPDVSTKLKEPKTMPRAFEDIVSDMQQAAVLVLVY